MGPLRRSYWLGMYQPSGFASLLNDTRRRDIDG